MTVTDIRQELDEALASDLPLPRIVAMLRDYRDQGFSRTDVQNVLEAMRAAATEEATEDRILEVMDFVSGFCSANEIIWDD